MIQETTKTKRKIDEVMDNTVTTHMTSMTLLTPALRRRRSQPSAAVVTSLSSTTTMLSLLLLLPLLLGFHVGHSFMVVTTTTMTTTERKTMMKRSCSRRRIPQLMDNHQRSTNQRRRGSANPSSSSACHSVTIGRGDDHDEQQGHNQHNDRLLQGGGGVSNATTTRAFLPSPDSIGHHDVLLRRQQIEYMNLRRQELIELERRMLVATTTASSEGPFFADHEEGIISSSSSSRRRVQDDDKSSQDGNDTNDVDDHSTTAQHTQETAKIFIRNDEDIVVVGGIKDKNGISSPSSSTAPSPSSMAISMPSMGDVWKARWLLIGAAALYGTNFSFVKMLGETDLPVSLSAAARFGLAAIVTAPWLFMPADTSKSVSQNSPIENEIVNKKNDDWDAAVAGFEVGIWVSIGYLAQAVGLETTPASQSAFLCSLAVVVVPILDFVFKGKSLRGREMVGAALAMFGVGALELGGDIGSAMVGAQGSGGSLLDFSSFSVSSGDLASMVQPFAFGMGFWRMESAMHKYPHQANRSTASQLVAVFVGSFLYCSYVMATTTSDVSSMPMMIMDQFGRFFDWDWLSSNPTIVSSLLWTGIITTALTVYMETLALKTLSAVETTVIFSTEPVWGAICASIVMNESFGVHSIVGGIAILMACVSSNLGLDGMKKLLPHSSVVDNRTHIDEDEDEGVRSSVVEDDDEREYVLHLRQDVVDAPETRRQRGDDVNLFAP